MNSVLPLVFLSLLSFPKTSPTPTGELRSAGGEPGLPRFVELEGIQELSGQMIVRPLGPAALRRLGREAARRVQALLSDYERVAYIPQTRESILRVPPDSNEEAMAGRLMASGLFEYAEPDWIVYPETMPPTRSPRGPQSGSINPPPQGRITPTRATNCPDDPLFSSQWHHQADRMRSCEAWALSSGSPQISVGVCDTGVRTTHQDLLLHRLEGYNAVDHLWESEGGDIGPAMFHGTRTTGVVCGNGDNGLGICGVGWNLSHRMIRVSNLSNGGAQLSDLQHGARTSIESGDRVANVSYHGAYFASNQTTARYVKSLGGLLVWSAGNTSTNYSAPGRDSDDLLVVGATALDDSLAWFSSYGAFVDLVAPGVSIWTTDYLTDSSYTAPEGTSYSAPLVSGLCALIWSRRPELSPSDVERILKTSCQDIGASGVDDFFGYGRIDSFAALSLEGTSLPSVDFDAPIKSGLSPLRVDFRDLSTGIPSSWSWDFGDGTSSNEQNPSHVYAASGTYTVTLTVGNQLGGDSLTFTDFVLVDVIPPVADFAADPSSGLSPLAVQFQDLSSGGIPDTWLWDFGDGTSSNLAQPAHVYATSGYYSVSLTVTNAYGSSSLTKSNYIVTDFIPPIANFSALPISGNSPLMVDFTDESGGGVTTAWQWSFGDGGFSVEQHPSHLYTLPGSYTVSLTATNAYGSDQRVEVGYVDVGPGPPVIVEFSASPTSGSAPLVVQFTDESIGHLTSWLWQFDDGTTSTQQNPQHTFTAPGEYNIVLEVVDDLGDDFSIEKQAYISVQ